MDEQQTTDLATRIVVAHEYDRAEPKLRVKLAKAATKEGSYGWDIGYEGDAVEGVLAEIKRVDAELRVATAPRPVLAEAATALAALGSDWATTYASVRQQMTQDAQPTRATLLLHAAVALATIEALDSGMVAPAKEDQP